jgi:prepilin peptidase CpaA
MAAVIDWRNQRIPNLLTLGGALAGIILQALFFGLDGLLAALGGWAVGFAMLIPGYALQQTGAGDVKLMGAVGTFLGPATALLAGIGSIIIGACVSLVFAAWGQGASPWQRYGSMLRCLVTTGRTAYEPPRNGEVMAQNFPYGVAIAVGTLLAVWLENPLLMMDPGG